jgi:hypothetical protein
LEASRRHAAEERRLRELASQQASDAEQASAVLAAAISAAEEAAARTLALAAKQINAARAREEAENEASDSERQRIAAQQAMQVAANERLQLQEILREELARGEQLELQAQAAAAQRLVEERQAVLRAETHLQAELEASQMAHARACAEQALIEQASQRAEQDWFAHNAAEQRLAAEADLARKADQRIGEEQAAQALAQRLAHEQVLAASRAMEQCRTMQAETKSLAGVRRGVVTRTVARRVGVAMAGAAVALGINTYWMMNEPERGVPNLESQNAPPQGFSLTADTPRIDGLGTGGALNLRLDTSMGAARAEEPAADARVEQAAVLAKNLK